MLSPAQGHSAGGLNALTRVLAPLPATPPAAVLVVQHLNPERDSTLASTLDKRSALNVRPADNGDLLTVGRVLVAPPGYHLLVISSARIGLIKSGHRPPARPSADLLLATLAVTCGPRALAVVLAGAGTDAQAGIRAIRHGGGTVFVQNETSSEQVGMPAAAIDTGLVDAVVPLDELAQAVKEHALTHQG